MLALGWAVYLIPKALQRNEELAKTRLVDTFSDRMRVLGDGKPPVVPTAAPTSETVPQVGLTREAARRAARRRRRVLMVLVFALGMVGALAGFAIAPVWSPAIPAGLIVFFLITARISVRRQQRRVVVPVSVSAEIDDADEETVGTDVSEIREQVQTPAPSPAPAAEEVIPDGGSLWDPLPMTLPTYVTKPTARRTVRAIELTMGVTSSGHDAADSKLALEAKAAEQATRDAEKATESTSTPEQRKAAGA